VIIRLMGEGQYRIDDGVAKRLEELDNEALAALERGDEDELDSCLDAIWNTVKKQGAPLPDDEIATSDAIVPPSDLTLEETRELFSEQGLIPDLPT
jgi:PspA-Associated protein